MYAEVSIPNNPSKPSFTYKIPEKLKINEGDLVNVNFRNRVLSGIVIKITNKKPPFAVKPISSIPSSGILLKKWQLELAKWISDYYFCPFPKILKLFLPKAKRIKPEIKGDVTPLPFHKTLTDKQKEIVKAIIETKNKKFLIHGVTGSGKTEIYLQLATHYAKKGQQILILTPEIGLTSQLLQYFKYHFENRISVIHSKLSEGERRQEWLKISEGKIDVIIGSRSALFQPFKNLGLIIMDEEHEWTYKQDSSPRYHAREVALKITELLNNKFVLGSATPDIITYDQAKNKEYQLFEISERFGEIALPSIRIADMREELKKQNYSAFSDLLRDKIEEKLSKKEQILLFLNKRGMASSILCRDCGHIVKCKNCDVPLTYHNSNKKLICHHCGAMSQPPVICPECDSHAIRYLGTGTEKIEQELNKLFPNIRVLRADSDTVTRKGSFEKIYNDFKEGKADILIGTQMIGKGLHLPKVNLVGVILADIGLNIPDFKSSERTFQLLTQVAGRAGREEPGEVVIQTYMPENSAIRYAKNHDFKGFYKYEIQNRKLLGYPPFSKIIKLIFADKDPKKCPKEAQKIANSLKLLVTSQQSPEKISIQAAPALIMKLYGKYRWNVIIKGENPEIFLEKILEKESLKKGWRIDRDPINLT